MGNTDSKQKDELLNSLSKDERNELMNQLFSMMTQKEQEEFLEDKVEQEIEVLYDKLPENKQDEFLAKKLAMKRKKKKKFNKIMTMVYDLPKGVFYFDAVFVTRRYDLFGFIKGNRPINIDNARRINRSTRVNGQVPIPVTTNYNKKTKKYEISDGQHRFTGWSMNSEFPIIFTNMDIEMDDETLVKIVSSTNTSQSHWSLKNFVQSGATISESYQNLLKILEQYSFNKNGDDEKIPAWTIINASVGMCGYSSNGDPKKMVELGAIDLTDKYDTVKSLVETLIPINNRLSAIGFYSKIPNKKDRFLSVLSFFIQRDNFDIDHFLNNVVKYGMVYNFNKFGQQDFFTFIKEVYEKDLKPGKRYPSDLYKVFSSQNEKARKANSKLIEEAQKKFEANLLAKKAVFDRIYDSVL